MVEICKVFAKGTSKIWISFFITSLFVFSPIYAESWSIASLHNQSKKFTQYQNEISSFSDSFNKLGNDKEFEICKDFENLASNSRIYLDAVFTSLYIYQNMSSQVDRDEVKPMVLEQIKHYNYLINISIKEVNLGLAHTSNYSVTRMGTNLKQDLKKSISILESASKSL